MHIIKTDKLIVENSAQTSLGYLSLAYPLPAEYHGNEKKVNEIFVPFLFNFVHLHFEFENETEIFKF